ncbi:class I adenylate-forming enzyme family protein [Corynebacterium nuruki]|uniref:class I adenylate-forming enzyme family protein n=1 Tax=Corynebacterium nuruki TaxID=1032851 RepID=UPI00265798E0|nr:AMP-binding protein [Corynebacterium nuruki]
MNLYDVLESTVRRRPDHPAVEWDAGSLTYTELRDAACRAATVFTDGGVLPGDRVMVMTLNDPGFLVAMYGLWRCGAVLVPVNHKMTPPELAQIAANSRAVLGVVSDRLAETAQEGAPDIPWLTTGREPGTFEDAVAAAAPYRGDLADETDYAQVLYTSGSTGNPKGCVMTHRAVSAIAPNMVSNMPFTPDERMLMSMPVWHASPLNNWLLTTLFVGGTVVLMREYDPAQFLAVLEERRITAVFGAPVAFIAPVQLARAGVGEGVRQPSDYDLSAVNMLIYGAAPLGEEMARMLIDAYGTDRFYQVYGMTETGPSGTVLHPADQVRKAGSIGRGGMLGVDLKVVAEDGSEVVADGEGEIWMRCDSMMSVYLSNPEATAEVFLDGWYVTGDVAKVDADGYIYIADRKKDVIITGGENVYSSEVEEAIRDMPEVRDVAVVGRVHPEWGETVVAVVVTDEGQLLGVDEVRAHLAGKLAKYKIPREVVVARGLPRNPSGKLLKHVIRAEVNA